MHEANCVSCTVVTAFLNVAGGLIPIAVSPSAQKMERGERRAP